MASIAASSGSGKNYRVAVIGAGRMGGFIDDEIADGSFHKPYSHAGAYQHIEQTHLVAVASRGEERLKRFADRYGIPAQNAYTDYRAMIEREKPDIVSVTTPSFARAEPIIFAAEHGVRGIYAEKGLSASLEEADRIAAAVRKHDVAFNWGAMRRHHSGFRQLADAIARGEIGAPKYAAMYFFTDLITHHPHTLDTVAMLIGDPVPEWVEGRLIEPGTPEAGSRALPTYDRERKRFLPPQGQVYASPYPSFYRVGYKGGIEASFIPYGRLDVDVVGTEGRAYAWDNGQRFATWRSPKTGRGGVLQTPGLEQTYTPHGDSPTVSTIRDIIRQLETGERTKGNIDVTMHSVEVQFGLVESHLRGGTRVALPIQDRSVYIPGR
ncbi:MAG TPA: Gfo/Idh/MocA family oxidoreductase [Chloroflexota bacterium]|nr:Gfo/Idh/MocA family oxidoreductase [Chloroflexota bacterium]